MTTTAIGIIALSTLFFFNNYEIKPNSANLEKVAKSIQEQKIQTKTTVANELPNTKIKEKKHEPKVIYDKNGKPFYGEFYTENLTDERIKNATYLVRDDYYIPNTLEPIDLDKIYFSAFLGDIANEYSISFNEKFENGEDAKNYIENLLGYKIISYSMDTGNDGMLIIIELPEKTAKEVENVKTTLQYLEAIGEIKSSYINSATLPEYRTKKFENIIIEMQLL